MYICGHVSYCNQTKRLNKSKACLLFIDLMQINLSKILRLKQMSKQTKLASNDGGENMKKIYTYPILLRVALEVLKAN